ncbi:hypothetical protein WJX84_000320 [Apatococcus fuscideae]|uniref:PDEase domain-containing protein n=1 Tax=Apatococcus fuscideae TaxID=2026836 RepID=A0AAW1T283_9CHLO
MAEANILMQHEKVISNDTASKLDTRKRVWTMQSLRLLDHLQTPCWVARPIRGDPVVAHVWTNTAAKARFGRSRTYSEIQDILRDCPPQVLAVRLRIVQDMLDGQRTGTTHRFCCDVKKVLGVTFTQIRPEETYAFVLDKPIRLDINGIEETLLYLELEENIPADMARAKAMQHFSPIHSFMFDAHGELLHANEIAARKLLTDGRIPHAFKLASLLKENGLPRPELAEKALHALFVDRLPTHRVTLAHHNHPKTTYVEYQFCQAEDPVAHQPACLVCATNVTFQRHLELEIQTAQAAVSRCKEELTEGLQSSNDLAARQKKLFTAKAKIAAERQLLDRRLVQLLEVQSMGAPSFDTECHVDRMLRLLDDIAEGQTPSKAQLLHLRHLVVDSPDLRQPVGLSSLGRTESANVPGACLLKLLQGHADRTRESWQQSPVCSSGSQSDQSEAAHVSNQTRSLSGGSAGPRSAVGSIENFKAIAAEISANTAIIVPITPIAERLMKEAETDFHFDIFAFSEATNGMPLSTLTFFLLKRCNLMASCSISERSMAAYLRRLELGYDSDNPFHNRQHAAAVVQIMHVLFNCAGGLRESLLITDISMLGCYLSACAIDFEHPGVTNDYLVKTNDRLALLYNGQLSFNPAAFGRSSWQPDRGGLLKLADVSWMARPSHVYQQ